jgi:hypothetical protein
MKPPAFPMLGPVLFRPPAGGGWACDGWCGWMCECGSVDDGLAGGMSMLRSVYTNNDGDRCYDFKNSFAEKYGENIGVFSQTTVTFCKI